jgi:sugar O-acyltransferase (sialic acid O-acetyltransferase NeuD family)
MIKPQIILIGGGGHCKSCIDVIEMQDKFRIVGILDISENIGNKVLGYPIIGNDNDIDELSKSNIHFLITLGQIHDYSKRIAIYEKLAHFDVDLPVIVSPNAYVSKHAKIGRGTIIMHFAIINADAEIGENCIINNRALIEHDATIGNHCHISTGAIVNGGVNIGNNSFYGSGAVSKEYSVLPENSFIKANTIVK